MASSDELTDKEINDFLIETKRRLETQDCRATANPIFIVYDWEKIPTQEDYSDKWEYADLYDGYQAIGNTKKELIDFAKDNDTEIPIEILDADADDVLEWLNKNGFNLIKNYYIEKRIFKAVFFTEQAADNYIAANHYHFTKEVHTYVDSLWRNDEMKTIRNLLLSGRLIKNGNV